MENEFKTKGLWVAGKFYCPLCVQRLSDRKPTDLAYRSECFQCEFYRINMYGGLSLDGERENPRYICLKFQAREACVFDEPKPVKPPSSGLAQQTRTSSPGVQGSWWTTTVTQLTAATQPKPPTSESLPPKPEPISLVGAVSNLPARPRLESPAPKRKSPPRRDRRRT